MIDASTLSVDDIRIVGPGGELDRSSFTLTAVPTDERAFLLELPSQSDDGDYVVEVGPVVSDLSGNPMSSASQATITLDITSPEVTSVSPSGDVRTTIESVVVTFNEAIAASTFKALDVTVQGPDGQVSGLIVESLSLSSYRVSFSRRRAIGDYTVIVSSGATDLAGNPMLGTFESTFRILIPNLHPAAFAADASLVPVGGSFGLSWTVANIGNDDISTTWVDRIYLSADANLSLSDRLLFAAPRSGLAASASYDGQVSITLPLDETLTPGAYSLIFVTDAAHDVNEADETDNQAIAALTLTIPPHADLNPTLLVAPARIIGDPAHASLSWTVANHGDARTSFDRWDDVLVMSADAVYGYSDDKVLGTFRRVGALDPDASYTREGIVTFPPATSGRFHIFIATDTRNEVYEGVGGESNVAEADHLVDVMPIPYSDLVVASITLPDGAGSGQAISATWTVENQGIGLTSTGYWTDRVQLASDPQGKDIVAQLGKFEHFGHVDASGSYSRTGTLTIPNGIEGTYYIVVTTAFENAPYEFLYGTNNTTISAPLPIVLSDSPDMTVTRIVAPLSAEEGSVVDFSWQVSNLGPVAALGTWVDRVYLQKAGDTSAPVVELGQFRYIGTLAAGQHYDRSEAIRVPVESNELYYVFVTTDFAGEIYENGTAENNNTSRSDNPLSLSAKPRADLQVREIIIPERVPAGAPLSVDFVIINQGPVATGSPRWKDKVYLSLDATIDRNDVVIGEIDNQAALKHGEEYASSAGPIIVPKWFRGDVYVIVATDSDEAVEEWPHEDNNVRYKAIYVEPLPLPDLVTGQVVAPDQAVAGSEIEVRYTVTNLGSGPTDVETWTETIWLTQDRSRPNPAHGDILLKTLSHTGSLDRKAGYDVTTKVRIPREIDSGTWYITPWTDPFDQALEDTLASNSNEDDPNEIDNNNYKARLITIIGALPDLVVTDIVAPAIVTGGTSLTVQWTVQNKGTASALPGGWGDRIYLSNLQNPKAKDARTLYLGQLKHDLSLGVDETYTSSMTFALSPSAVGLYIIVIADDAEATTPGISIPGFTPPPNPQEQFTPVKEANETNNGRAEDIIVSPVPANLVVTHIDVPQVNFSGESATFTYTVTNMGGEPVWAGTKSWKDFIWLSADTTFIRMRASYLGSTVHVQDKPLKPGESYDVTFTAKLPEGTGGAYSLWIHMDAHNDLSPLLFPYQARLLLTDWWRADTGSNSDWVSHFNHWAFEDPRDNLARADVPITYREADLQTTTPIIPSSAVSGQTIALSYTVKNIGQRDTRVTGWTDRVFISHDASLDNRDHELSSLSRSTILASGDTYDVSLDVRLPDDIKGTFLPLGLRGLRSLHRPSAPAQRYRLQFDRAGIRAAQPARSVGPCIRLLARAGQGTGERIPG